MSMTPNSTFGTVPAQRNTVGCGIDTTVPNPIIAHDTITTANTNAPLTVAPPISAATTRTLTRRCRQPRQGLRPQVHTSGSVGSVGSGTSEKVLVKVGHALAKMHTDSPGTHQRRSLRI
eukprot:m.464236 g.464236  ORF g.464236 m.464236 type:complete len:119 (-) comp21616_c3_seq15:22-378(-)